ncbi:hypothetical protein ACFL6Y_06900 [Elusimicrobiota bacterium]
MAHAYTPGLKVLALTKIQKKRLLPIPGEVNVKVGDKVKATDTVAITNLPGKVHSINIINRLGVMADEIRHFMKKKEGDAIQKDEALAENKFFISWFSTIIPSPITGNVETVSEITGQVLLREPPKPLPLAAYISSEVKEVIPKYGVVVEAEGSFIQGILGVGGETHGKISIISKNPKDELDPSDIQDKHKGQVVIGGAHASWESLQKAKAVGVAGLIVGGIHDKDLKALLKYDLGVAVTGTEDIGFTLVITEGFGTIPMAEHTYKLLCSREGEEASISGATQIRAGVMRPEIIIPGAPKSHGASANGKERGALSVGDPIRVIREPYFGKIGKVSALPSDLQKIETESKVRILEVALESGETVTIPRANTEILEQ